jgi:hypothetical protein
LPLQGIFEEALLLALVIRRNAVDTQHVARKSPIVWAIPVFLEQKETKRGVKRKALRRLGPQHIAEKPISRPNWST